MVCSTLHVAGYARLPSPKIVGVVCMSKVEEADEPVAIVLYNAQEKCNSVSRNCAQV